MAEDVARKNIFVCDDDPDTLELVSHLLRSAGYFVVTAHGHSELLKQMQENEPDLVVLDIRMPECDGFWIAESLRAAGKSAPIIFLTAHDTPGYRLVATLVSKTVGFIVKPFDPEELLKAVDKALKQGTSARTAPVL